VTRAHLTLLAVVVVWAGSFSVIKELLDNGAEAGDIALLRYAIAAPGFAFILWRARGLAGIHRADALRVAAAGVVVVVGYHLSLNIGTQYTTAGVAALVVALAPGMTLLLAVAAGLERLQAGRVLGLAIALLGVGIVVALGTGEELSFESAKGPLIVLGAPLAFALYNVILKPLLGRYDLLALTAATSLVGTVALLPLVRGSTIAAAGELSAGDVALVLYLGVAATLLGYIGWNIGLRGLGPTRAVAFTYAISPLAVLIGALVIDEPVTIWLALGGVLVVGGIALAQGAFSRQRAPEEGDVEATVAPWPPEPRASSRSAS
jgi:drug/metabolite transporter (DMT)-like permease